MNPLLRPYMADLAVDIRCALRDAQPAYAKACYLEFRMLYRSRHKPLRWIYGRPSVIRG